ncbi:MAG: hypothetical protein ACI4TB_08620 [Lachnospiraceae bacterium]
MEQQVPVYEMAALNKVFGKEIKYRLMFYENRLEIWETKLLSKAELKAAEEGASYTFEKKTLIPYDKVTNSVREMVLNDFRLKLFGEFLVYRADGTTENITWVNYTFSPQPGVDYEMLFRTYCPTILPDVKVELEFKEKISRLSAMTAARGSVNIKRPVWPLYFRILVDGCNVPVSSEKQVQLQLPYGTYLISVEYDKVWDDGTSSPFESDKIQITLCETSPVVCLKASRPVFFKPKLKRIS